MTTVKDIYNYIDSIAPFETAMSFDNVGLLVGDESCSSEIVLTALDATPDVIKEAAELDAKIVFTHHPVIFNPIKKLSEQDAVYFAARYGISIISAHTNLDIARGGVNETLARTIGVEPIEYFDEECALLGTTNKTTCESFCSAIYNALSLEGLRYTSFDREIERVMVSCGAGGSNIFLAAKNNVQAFVTGEIKHHEIIFANTNKIAVFDLGHFGSEKIIVTAMNQALSQKFPDTRFIKSRYDTDNMMYYSGGKHGT